MGEASHGRTHWDFCFMRVYVIVLKDSYETFVKIGAAKNLTQRFRYFKSMGYKVVIKKIYKTKTFREALNLERSLHKNNRFYRHIPIQQFSGYTECFTNVLL